jgi:hypothetical protein
MITALILWAVRLYVAALCSGSLVMLLEWAWLRT